MAFKTGSPHDIQTLTLKAAPHLIHKSPQTKEGPKGSDIVVWGGHTIVPSANSTGAASNRSAANLSVEWVSWVRSGLTLAGCDSNLQLTFFKTNTCVQPGPPGSSQ